MKEYDKKNIERIADYIIGEESRSVFDLDELSKRTDVGKEELESLFPETIFLKDAKKINEKTKYLAELLGEEGTEPMFIRGEFKSKYIVLIPTMERLEKMEELEKELGIY